MEMESIDRLKVLLEQWKDSQDDESTVLSTIEEICSIIEPEVENFYKTDPDPFDTRNPASYTKCALGKIVQELLSDELFIHKAITSYLTSSTEPKPLCTATARLLVDILPALDMQLVIEDDESLFERLVKWATVYVTEPIAAYAYALLAAALESHDLLAMTEEKHKQIIPIALDLLHKLRIECGERNNTLMNGNGNGNGNGANWDSSPAVFGGTYEVESPALRARCVLWYLATVSDFNDYLPIFIEHRIVDLLAWCIDVRANNGTNRDVRLAFDALRVLSVLLCHKRFASEWIAHGGVERLLAVPRPSVAAYGVAVCLYYLAYFEDAFERVCLAARERTLRNLVEYALWLLECAYDTGRWHALTFFAAAFRFRVVLQLFDKLDGLRKLINVASTLPVVIQADQVDEPATEVEYERAKMKQYIRNVCAALKAYFEAHVVLLADLVRNSGVDVQAELGSLSGIAPPLGPSAQSNCSSSTSGQTRLFSASSGCGRRTPSMSPAYNTVTELPAHKAMPVDASFVNECLDLLLLTLPSRISWRPLEEFARLGGIPLLMQLLRITSGWSISTMRNESLCAALDALAVCALMPDNAAERFAAPVRYGLETTNVIAELVQILQDAATEEGDVIRAALSVVVMCVCAPAERFRGDAARMLVNSAHLKAHPTADLLNVVYPSSSSGGASSSQPVSSSRRVQQGGSSARQRDDSQLQLSWNAFRMQNAIVTLLNLLAVKTPINDADAIRACACRALVGLARDETVRQILGKLPVFTKGQLQQLTREPVLVDNLQQHAAFIRYSVELIRRVCADVGQLVPLGTDISIERLRKADIAASTPIVYNELELLYLIHKHLLANQLPDTAQSLLRELKRKYPLGPVATPVSSFNLVPAEPQLSMPGNGNGPVRTAEQTSCFMVVEPDQPGDSAALGNARTPNRIFVRRTRPISAAAAGIAQPLSVPIEGVTAPSRLIASFRQSNSNVSNLSPQKLTLGDTPSTSGGTENRPRLMRTTAAFASPQVPAVQRIADIQRNVTAASNLAQPNIIVAPSTPASTYTQTPLAVTVPLNRAADTSVVSATPHSVAAMFGFSEIGWPRSATVKKPGQDVTLERIVTEYLRKQHALCPNPLRTCPPFSLFEPHKCPEVRTRHTAPVSIARRIALNGTIPPCGGVGGARENRRFVFSRFKQFRTIRFLDDDEAMFQCCTFSADQRLLLLGTSFGDLKFFDVQTGAEVLSHACYTSDEDHEWPITNCQAAPGGRLLLTSSELVSTLWSLNSVDRISSDTFLQKAAKIEEANYAEFGKLSSDYVIATLDDRAKIFDTNVGQTVVELYDQHMMNSYEANKATFNPTDDLVLSDGVLWDVNSGKAIHKFDKFASAVSGIFHPAGLEIIINSEVWDSRTFKLLHTIPSLDHCEVRFNANGTVLYSVMMNQGEGEELDETIRQSFVSTFRTFDATDYAHIVTVDLRHPISALAPDSRDCFVAVIETCGSSDNREMFDGHSVCRLYEVGRRRDDVDDAGDQDSEDGAEESSDSDDSDSDDEDSDTTHSSHHHGSHEHDAAHSNYGDEEESHEENEEWMGVSMHSSSSDSDSWTTESSATMDD